MRAALSFSPLVPRTSPLSLLPGTLIEGYRLERYLGHGCEGTVYRAIERVTGIVVAVKLITYDIGTWRTARRAARQFHKLRGLGIAATYHKLGIVQLPCGKRVIYLVSDLLEGQRLADRLKQRRWSLEWAEHDAYLVLLRLVEGLAAAHRPGVAVGDFEFGNNILLVAGHVPVFCDLDPGNAHLSNRDYVADLEIVADIAATLAEVRARSLRLANITASARRLALQDRNRRTMTALARETARLR